MEPSTRMQSRSDMPPKCQHAAQTPAVSFFRLEGDHEALPCGHLFAHSELARKEKVSLARLAMLPQTWQNIGMKMRVRELRKNLDLTGEQLGDMVGVSKGYISEIENEKKHPGSDLLMRLAEALRCSVGDLFEDGSEGDAAELHAHLQVMAQLPPEDRRAIEKAALGLLAKQP